MTYRLSPDETKLGAGFLVSSLLLSTALLRFGVIHSFIHAKSGIDVGKPQTGLNPGLPG